MAIQAQHIECTSSGDCKCADWTQDVVDNVLLIAMAGTVSHKRESDNGGGRLHRRKYARSCSLQDPCDVNGAQGRNSFSCK